MTLTDGSPRMVARAAEKLRRAGYGKDVWVEQALLENLDAFVRCMRARSVPPFDGAYSNFAAFNCIPDLSVVAQPLARMLRPGAACILVVFGPCSIGEIVVQLARRDFRAAVRRFRRGPVPARLGGESFEVWYPSPWRMAGSLAPYFRLRRVRGIGIFVPPSAAEPWISRFPRVIAVLEAMDQVLSAPLALLADHVLLHLERTEYAPRP